MALTFLPSTAVPGTDFDPYVWDPDQWLAIELTGAVCRGLLREVHEAMDAYWGVSALDPEHARADLADPLVLTLLGLVAEQRIASPARGFHLLQCLGAQLYRLNSGRQKVDPLLYWTNLCGKSQVLLEAAEAQTLGGRLRRAVEAWLHGLGIDVQEEGSVVQALYRLSIPHMKSADALLCASIRVSSPSR